MRLGLVIPTHNAAAYLPRILEALEGFDREYTEVIAVDDASDDATGSILKDHGIKTIRLEKNSGPGIARNSGAAAASADVLLFCDADIVLPADTPRIVDEFFREHPGIDAFSGVYALDKGAQNTIAKYRNTKERHEELSRPPVSCACRMSAFAIKKDVFTRTGGFDQNWGYFDCEDTIFCSILARHNIKIASNPRFEVRHIKKYSFSGFLRQAFNRSQAAFCAMRSLGRQFEKQYYQKGFYLSSLMEFISPSFILFCLVLSWATGYRVFFVPALGALFCFFYAQKSFYLYARRSYGLFFAAACFALRFLEMLISEAALAAVLVKPQKK